MKRFDEKAAMESAAKNDNVISLVEIKGLGGTKKVSFGRVQRNVWQAPQRGVYTHSAAPLTFRQRVIAALAYCGPKARASHRTAAFLEGLDGVPEPEVIEITMPQSSRMAPAGVHLYRSRRPMGRMRRADGVPVTPLERTLVDIASLLSRDRLEQAVESALVKKLTTEERIYVEIVERGGRGVAGSRLLWSVMHQRPKGRPARSYFEIRTGHALRAGGLGHFERNFPVAVDGEPFELDKAYPNQMVVVESDGDRWHRTRSQIERDRHRQRKLEAAGWRFRRVKYAETLTSEGRAALVADIRNLLGANGHTLLRSGSARAGN